MVSIPIQWSRVARATLDVMAASSRAHRSRGEVKAGDIAWELEPRDSFRGRKDPQAAGARSLPGVGCGLVATVGVLGAERRRQAGAEVEAGRRGWFRRSIDD